MSQVLIADDDPISLLLVRRHLERVGYSVSTATTGLEAVAGLMDPNGPTLAVLDWMMPEVDGPEIIRRLRADRPDRYVYTILLTSRKLPSDLLTAFDSGADDYLTKPFDARELIARLRVGERIIRLQTSLKEANKRLHDVATLDTLTGLPNRRETVRVLKETIAHQRARNMPLAVLMIDLDHFKKVNDRFGHAGGDQALQQVGTLLRKGLRLHDMVGRIGGEEFLAVLPECDSSSLLNIAERFRSAVSDSPVQFEGKSIPMTCSIGAAYCFPEQRLDAAQMMKAADEALYRAKAGGRDQVVAAWLPNPPLLEGVS